MSEQESGQVSEQEKEAIVKLKHYANITAYWKQEEFTNSEIDYYIKLVLNYIEKLQKENKELKEKIENKIKEYEEELKYEITRNEAKIIIKVLRDLLKE